MLRLRVHLLGGFRAELEGRPVAEAQWRRNRARAVVKLLALAGGHRLHREQLMDALWPDLDAEAAAANLRKALHFARRALAPDCLAVRAELVALEADELWIDAVAFEAAAREGRLAEAAGLYQGDLLPEDRFEPWSEEPRERLRARYQRLLLELAAESETAADLEGAAESLERLLASDPLQEEAHRGLMRLWALGGARHLALRQYRLLQARLLEELAVEPSAETRRLQEEILAGRYPPASEAPDLPPPARLEPATEPPGAPSEERKLVTVLWADPVAAAGDPELARKQLDDCLDLCAGVVKSWGGRAERQVGGSLVAVFGVPDVHEDDAARALRAGLELLERAPLPIRVGISTGEVIATIGPEVNLQSVAGEGMVGAGRLREAAELGHILAGERTCQACPAGFRFSEPSRIDGIVARTLLGEDRAAVPSRRSESPLIGRGPELAGLVGLFEQVSQSRRPQLVVLFGQAGIGKSRLTREVVMAVQARHPGTRVLTGRCLSAGTGTTYWALGEILREASGISLADSAELAQRRLRKGLRSLLAEMEPAEVEASIFALATSAGISLPGNPLERLPPAEVKGRLSVAWPAFASACAAAAPTLLVFEDLHWASPELLEMLEQLTARSTGPLLILATARPELREADPGFGAGVDLSAVSLQPLGEDPSRELLDSLLAESPLGRELRDQLLARAEGNPFFLEQLALHMGEGGTASLPDTLQSLLAARLDSLPPAERRLLQEAAVVGRVFWQEPLDRALGLEHLGARLAALERKGFVYRRPTSSLPGQTELSFRHALLRDVAYEALPRERRASAHAGMGAWLEELAGERQEEVSDLLAHHYWSALGPIVAGLVAAGAAEREPVRRKAFEHLQRAGTAARKRFAAASAVQLHQRAREIAADPGERLQVLEELAEDHDSALHGNAAEPVYREAIGLARLDDSRAADRARLCRKLAWMMAFNPGAFSPSPDPVDVEALVAEGLAANPDAPERAWLQVVEGACARLYKGSEPFGQGTRLDPRPIGERIALVEQAIATGQACGREDVVHAGNRALGLLLGAAGRYAEMLELAQEEVTSLGPGSSRLDRSDALRKVAVHLIQRNADYEQALELGRRCHELATGTGQHQLMHATWPILAALFELGRWQELLSVLDEHLAAFRKEPAVECQFVRDGPVIGATVLTLMGRPEDARALAALVGDPLADRESASAWQARYAVISGDPETARLISADKALEGRSYGPQHAFTLLAALTAQDDWKAVLDFVPRARHAVGGNAMLAPAADRAEGRAWLAGGDSRRAATLLRRSARGFRSLKAHYEEAKSLENLASALVQPAAGRAQDAALAIFRRIGVEPAAQAHRQLV